MVNYGADGKQGAQGRTVSSLDHRQELHEQYLGRATSISLALQATREMMAADRSSESTSGGRASNAE